MEQVKEEVEKKLPMFGNEGEDTLRLARTYEMIAAQDSLNDFLAAFMSSTESYWWADKQAREIADVKGRGREVYTSNSMELMHYNGRAYDSEDDYIDQDSIDLLTNALNNYLADSQVLPEDPRRAKKMFDNVRTLMIQLISQGFFLKLSKLRIPDYVKPEVNAALDNLKLEGERIFNEFIDDLVELDNEFLVDYITSIGPGFLAYGSKTKPYDRFNNYLKPYFNKIKNFGELYKRYQTRRNEYIDVSINIKQTKLYDSFHMTAAQFNKAQRNLVDEFQLFYDNDVSSQYIMKVINGIE